MEPLQQISPKSVLRDYFGYTRFREHQEEIIQDLIAGKDAFALMPTGSGKSLCYQIPAMIRPGVGIVVSPLIALMQDQVDALRQNGVRADFLNSSLTMEGAREVSQRVISGQTDLLYVAPERLMTTGFQRLLTQTRVALFAIDEAHCVSQWGHDFRPEYLQISILLEQFPNIPRVALTATADAVTRKEILEKLSLKNAGQFISSFDRPNICYSVELKQSGRKQLADFLQAGHSGDAGIIYCRSRNKVESTAEWLSGRGYTALPYHAGMDQASRLHHQRRFLQEDGVIIVATIAFGMGIDKPDVRFVAHLDMPKNMETYYQETGRAGRDGLPANAWMVYSLGDVVALRQMLDKSAGNTQFIRTQQRKTEAMLGFCETTQCRRQVLLSYFGETLPEPCGNCDTCQGKVETWDGTVAAQKALSCVYRTGQRFGAEYLSDVLTGKDNERIRRFRHDKVSTFGIGSELSKKEWKSVFRQLIAAGLLCSDMETKGGFYLPPQSRPVLRGEQRVLFRKDPVPSKKERGFRSPGERKEEFNDPASMLLWEGLRDVRLEIAKQKDVPPYVIFHDTTLRELVLYLPRSLEEMRRIYGIGRKKLELYGEAFLEVIQQHVQEYGVPDELPERLKKREQVQTAPLTTNSFSSTVMETLALFKKGMTPEQIAEHRELKTDTIYTHFSKAIEENDLSVDEIISLTQEEVFEIEKAFHALPSDQKEALKPIFDQFQGRYDYGILRCIRAGLFENQDKKQNRFDKQMVCLAVSRKYSRYCIAGKVLSSAVGEWIRPVSTRENRELSINDILLPNKKIPKLLDIITLSLIKPAPYSYQTENHIIDENRSWIKTGEFSLSDIPKLCDCPESLWTDGFHSYNGFNDRIPQEMADEKLSSSLLFIKPENVCITVGQESYDKKVRAKFDFNDKRYCLVITDPVMESKYLKKNEGQYPVNTNHLYFCVSVGEPYNGYCYKLVAGILGFDN
ncbi:DNA helicase RecQ [Desulfonema magnum]|nr:DNA helicase RecQ [Desulfonema magnum]